MPSRLGVGFTLQPDAETLALTEGLAVEEADYLEVMPETLWREGEAGRPVPNGYHAAFAALGRRFGKPFVGHGVAYSLASTGPVEAARHRRWHGRLRADHATFGFAWYTEHLGLTRPLGENLTLPFMAPMTPYAAALVRRRLRRLQHIVPDVGVENSVVPFLTGPALDEPAFIARCLSAPRLHLLLDLHNVYTMGLNFGFDPLDWIAGIDLSRVIEIHVSGGAEAPSRWLPPGPPLRLDSHDDAVPEPVWSLLDHVLPRCPNLRGVTLERMEGTVTPAVVPLLAEELRRIRRALEGRSPGGVSGARGSYTGMK